MNEHARHVLQYLGVSPELIALLPEELPYVLKESEGTNENLPPISATHHTVAALYVGKNRFLVALDPSDAQRYHDLTGAGVAADSKSTSRLVVHAHEAARAEAIPYFRDAILLAITRSKERDANNPHVRPSMTGAARVSCPIHHEALAAGTGLCDRCEEDSVGGPRG